VKLQTLAEIASDLACGACHPALGAFGARPFRPPVWAPQLPAREQERAAIRVLSTDAYDAWLIWWPPTTSVTPHDHGESAGAFSVLAGALQEFR